MGRSAAAAAAIAVGGIAVRRVLTSRGWGRGPVLGPADGRAPSCYVVTIDRAPAEVAPGGRLPEPIAQLGDGVEVTVRPAPGGRGTELAARLRRDEPDGLAGLTARLSGEDRRGAVRSALRQAKQLAETGEVLSPDRPATTRPPPVDRDRELPTREPPTRRHAGAAGRR